jgi:hypothetical protein
VATVAPHLAISTRAARSDHRHDTGDGAGNFVNGCLRGHWVEVIDDHCGLVVSQFLGVG